MIVICIAIAQAKGANTLTIEELEQGWSTNPDGGGFAYIDDAGLIVMQHSMDKDTFVLEYLEAHDKHGASSPFLVHMRIATHGAVQLSTCHPFDVPLLGDGEMVFAHNGIILEMNKLTDNETSDTMAFNDVILQELPDTWMDNPYLSDMISQYIGGSKFVILTTSPETKAQLYVINADLGVWVDDTWYSNYSCFAYKSAVSTFEYSNKTYYKSTVDDDADDEMYEAWARDVVGNKKDTFDTWLEELDVRYNANEMSVASTSERHAMAEECAKQGDACVICSGKNMCYCEDICDSCYEPYWDCDCSGVFMSLYSQWRSEVKEA